MKKFLLLIVTLAVVLAGCKKDDDNTPTDELRSKLTSNLNIMHEAGVIYNDVLQESGDSLSAFMAMSIWLANNPDVVGGEIHNVGNVKVEFANGLQSTISVIPVGENDQHLVRGGGVKGEIAAFRLNGIQSREIKNNKALLLIPYPEEFYYSSSAIQNLSGLIQSGSQEMEVDLEVGPSVELSDLDRLGDYGLIILDVHGEKNGFCLAYLEEHFGANDIWFPEDVIDHTFNVESIPEDKIANGEIEIGLHLQQYRDGSVRFRFNVLITEDYIRQLNIDLSHAVVFGNHCYSGHTADGQTTNNMPEAWRSKGASTYYGYADVDGSSTLIDNDFCKDMEQQLIQGLVLDGDTTGSAHLQANGDEFFYVPTYGYMRGSRPLMVLTVDTSPPEPTAVWPMYFRHYFDVDYQYENCSEDLVYQGQTYRTVCIGDQIWMAENLRYLPFQNTDQEFADASDNEVPAYGAYPGADIQVYGALYNWYAAMDNICPAGWHLPSKEEWRQLAEYTGLVSEAGAKLKSQNHWNSPSFSTDEYGFSAVGGGERGEFLGDFREIGVHGKYWTSTDVGPGIAVSAGFSYNADSFQSGNTAKGTGKACRCVKDQ